MIEGGEVRNIVLWGCISSLTKHADAGAEASAEVRTPASGVD
jgi:hypothetical protein